MSWLGAIEYCVLLYLTLLKDAPVGGGFSPGRLIDRTLVYPWPKGHATGPHVVEHFPWL
ncbi:hypothetical protein AB6T38_09580 [Aliiglaciecola sp. SL4]|uniref:hypothetical protein n=1 Tax=Aliiglaciecola sp. SL4 TaxID=3239806 RepID=UPI00355AED36